jgi:hypothetical protein
MLNIESIGTYPILQEIRNEKFQVKLKFEKIRIPSLYNSLLLLHSFYFFNILK